MKYLITKKENKTWQDKKYVSATLLDTAEVEYQVSAWAGEFDNVDEWEGELEKNDKGYWKIKKAPRAVNPFAKAKEASIEKAIEKKEKSISKFQDNKELSIKIASTMNKAVDLAIAEINDIKTLNTLEKDILKWREWLWLNWDVEDDQYSPF